MGYEIDSDNDCAEFFEKLSPIECVRSNIKKVVVHDFRGHLCEAVFLVYITQRVNKLEKLTLVLADKRFVQAGQDLLSTLTKPPWVTKACTVLLLVLECSLKTLNFQQASNLSIEDPFVSEHAQEVWRFSKIVE